MASVVDRKDRFISDILAMITSGSSNDVKIVLEDGEILANKDVLSARSEYFATMFSKKMFIEGETNQVTAHTQWSSRKYNTEYKPKTIILLDENYEAMAFGRAAKDTLSYRYPSTPIIVNLI